MCHGSSFAVSANQRSTIGGAEVALLEDFLWLTSPPLESDDTCPVDNEQPCMLSFKLPQGETWAVGIFVSVSLMNVWRERCRKL